MDHEHTQHDPIPEEPQNRAQPTRFGRDKRALRPRPATPATGAEAGEADAAPLTNDELVFEDRGGL